MKPPAFDYARPGSVDEVLGLLAQAPDDTNLLAGGQSLVPVLNMRLAQPRLVVDLNRVAGLDRIEVAPGGRVRIGAMVRQRRLESEAVVRDQLPLMKAAARYIAHLAIRTRGTVGGSLAHADPAAELPTTVAALDAELLVRGPNGERAIPAGEFFLGALTTAIEPGELLVAVEMTPPPPGTGWAFEEVARTHGAFALASAAALLHLDGGGRIDSARLALGGVGGAPYVPSWLAESTLGEQPSEQLFAHVGERVREEVEPYEDVHAPVTYRKRLAGVLAARALAAAAARAGNGAAPHTTDGAVA